MRTEIILNASLVTDELSSQLYEFVLSDSLVVQECGSVASVSQGLIEIIEDFPRHVCGLLFELNHVRVNPNLDNTYILTQLALALEKSGVEICHRPKKDDMDMCFKPIGELSDVVRFYLGLDKSLVFLSSSVKLSRVK